MSIWTEWDPLEEVIVGNCHEEIPKYWDVNPNFRYYLDRLFKETKEDLDKLSILIESFGIKVYRPKLHNFDRQINLPTFDIRSVDPIIPRDQYFIYGNNIYQTYTSMPDRYFDGYHYYDIFLELFENGYNWISQPPPLLQNFNKDSGVFWADNGPKLYSTDYKNLILWHTATFFKCGDCLITNWKGPGTQLGLKWMIRNIKSKILFNEGTDANAWGHIDQGFFMVNDDTVICSTIDSVPINLRKKKIVELKDFYMEENPDIKYSFSKLFLHNKMSENWLEEWFSEWKGYNQITHFETNVLVIDSNNIIFSHNQPKIFELLESMGINCHLCEQRHCVFWESAIHCFTLDVKRKGERRFILK